MEEDAGHVYHAVHPTNNVYTAVERGPVPERGFTLVRVDYTQPPETARTVIGHYNSLDEIVFPDGSETFGYVAYDSSGTVYSPPGG